MWSFFIVIALVWALINDLLYGQIPIMSVLLVAASANIPHTNIIFIITFLYTFVLIFISFFDLPLPLGIGDFLLFCAIGFNLGGESCFNIFCLSQVIYASFCIALYILEKMKNKKMLEKSYPLAPFILASYLILCLAEYIAVS